MLSVKGHDVLGFAVIRSLKNKLIVRVNQLRAKESSDVDRLTALAKCSNNLHRLTRIESRSYQVFRTRQHCFVL